MICGLPQRKRKEKKADKLSGKQANVTLERFLQFLSSSALLCISWIYIVSKNEVRERERKWDSPFINDTGDLIFQIIVSLLFESCVFYYNNIRYTFNLLIYFIRNSESFLIWIIKTIFYMKFNRHYWLLYFSKMIKLLYQLSIILRL